MNILTEDTKAIIMLCGVLGKKASVKPLSQTEYTNLVRWLIHANLRPSSLLDPEYIKDAASGSRLDEKRLDTLLGRGTQLGFAVENWQRNGIWVISRSDTDYPVRYKKHLKEKAPPLLFGVGDRSLLKGGGLAMIGSRNVDAKGEVFTQSVAKLCAANQMPVVSGGARGVDQISMETALEAGGNSIGILAESLLKKSLGKSFRKAIADNRLLLISPYHPEAPFAAWAAMGRNKFIYAMADFALVVSAEHKKGGTWAGASEELKRECAIPVFTRIDETIPKGNKMLLDLGAIQWPRTFPALNMNTFLKSAADTFIERQKHNNSTLFDQAVNQPKYKVEEKISILNPSPEKLEKTAADPTVFSSVYEAVLPVILEALSSPLAPGDLAEKLMIQKAQMNIWLKQAVTDGKIKKLTSPVRYKRVEK